MQMEEDVREACGFLKAGPKTKQLPVGPFLLRSY